MTQQLPAELGGKLIDPDEIASRMCSGDVSMIACTRVEPKTVEGIIPQPHLDVVQNETANLVGVFAVIVECAPPGRLVSRREIRIRTTPR